MRSKWRLMLLVLAGLVVLFLAFPTYLILFSQAFGLSLSYPQALWITSAVVLIGLVFFQFKE